MNYTLLTLSSKVNKNGTFEYSVTNNVTGESAVVCKASKKVFVAALSFIIPMEKVKDLTGKHIFKLGQRDVIVTGVTNFFGRVDLIGKADSAKMIEYYKSEYNATPAIAMLSGSNN